MIDDLLFETADSPFFDRVRRLVDELALTRVARNAARVEADELRRQVENLKSATDDLRRQLAECQAGAEEAQRESYRRGADADRAVADARRERDAARAERTRMLEKCENHCRQLAEVQAALESLTPGGSEFAGDPLACVRWVQERLLTRGRVAAERNALLAERNTLQHWLQLAHAALDTAGVCLACYGSGRVDGRHCTACHESGRADA